MSDVPLRTLALVLSLAAVAGLDAQHAAWRVESALVRVVCPLTVGGNFEARTPALAGTLTIGAPRAPLAGELSVDLRSLDTGIELRNTHMLGTYLEVDRGQGFDRAVLSSVLVSGDVETLSGSATFTGELRLHGVTKSVRGDAELTRSGSSVRVTAAFPVVLADHGIAPPRYLGVGVRDRVQVRVSFVAVPQSAGTTSQ
jgi:polyisoprenoid-binding protein YceI